MHEKITAPKHTPVPGFYYHYKHDPNDARGPVNNYAYLVLGTGHHTEDSSFFVVYRPLYEWALVYTLGQMFDVRPLEMFMEDVTKDGKTFPRFTKIEDEAVLAVLKATAREMYPALY